MRICLVCNQIAAWGKIGGFGTATRALGRGLARSGIDVVAVVPRRAEAGQGEVEVLDGIRVHGVDFGATLVSGRIFREIDADIYHSQEPTIASWWAQRAMPERIHVVTCRDPRGWRDHLMELRYASSKRRLFAPALALYEASPWVKAAVRRANAVLTPAPSDLTERIQRLYGPDVRPRFMPYPIEIPPAEGARSIHPYVLFVGRFDRRKRVELFFDLARAFPDVHFTAVGRAHDGPYDRRLREAAGAIPNLELPGFVPRFGTPDVRTPNVRDYYEKAWVLVNTSVREGLPYTFLEAAAHGNAILSSVDPQHFASRFGRRVESDDYAGGLRWLLEGERWRERGDAAARFVSGIWNEASCIDRHVELYTELLADPMSTPPARRTPARDTKTPSVGAEPVQESHS